MEQRPPIPRLKTGYKRVSGIQRGRYLNFNRRLSVSFFDPNCLELRLSLSVMFVGYRSNTGMSINSMPVPAEFHAPTRRWPPTGDQGSLATSGVDFTHAVEIPLWLVLPQAGPRSGRNADCANRFEWHADIHQQTAVTSRRKATDQHLTAHTTRCARA